MYNPAEHKEHVIAVTQACYEHMDMIWQEDWFEVWDEHLAPLFSAAELGSMPTSDANDYYKQVYELGMAAGDSWFQEDWFEFCEAMFSLALALANDGGWTDELVEKFPYAYQVSE